MSFREYRSTAPGDTTIEACSLPLASHELLTNMSWEDVRNSICRQCRTAGQLISQKEVAQRDSIQRGTQLWKLVWSCDLREEFLRSRWIQLRDTCLSPNLPLVSNVVLWKRSVQEVSMWDVQATSSNHWRTSRQLSTRLDTDKVEAWFSLRNCHA